jgi:hypothetical protein
MRHSIAVAGLVLSLACKRAESSAAPSGESPAPTVAGQPAKVTVTRDLIDRYLGFEHDLSTTMKAYNEKSKGKSINAQVSQNFGDVVNVGKTIDDARAKWGISDREEHVVGDVFSAIDRRRAAWSYGQALLKNMEERKAQLVQLPDSNPMKKELAGAIEKQITDLDEARDLKPERKRYGDDIVDYIVSKQGDRPHP